MTNPGVDGSSVIELVGPGGAGKTTTGMALAARLKSKFVDLDAEFMARNGDVSAFISRWGYEAYAARNVDTYLAIRNPSEPPGVMALSSGFMTYREDIHPVYAMSRQRIASSALTFVLLPSLELDECVAEVVRRQLQRPFARTPEREEQVIRSRFSVYANLSARKVVTRPAVPVVVEEIMALLSTGGSDVNQRTRSGAEGVGTA
ncbi:shikimate kinase [Leptospira sp. SA-E8]|uniref:shikimate kinase n=1 Tax=Leptospira sp. SA-E8 TaxID=3422259 RepID=UPI003EB6C6A5